MERVDLKNLARLIRYYILVATTAAGSGHPTTSLSATDLMTVLFFKYLCADLNQPQNPNNDRVIFSKGHASPLLYALYATAGKLTEQELLKLRTFDSPLEGHPVPRFRYTEAATGSLGQGLAVGVGEALALRYQGAEVGMPLSRAVKVQTTSFPSSLNSQGRDGTSKGHASPRRDLPRVFVLLGDGELAEGSVWEAAAAASYYKLGNLVAIADINGLGQSQETMYNRDISVYAKRFESFGWRVITVEDGHDLKEIDPAFAEALRLAPSFDKLRTVARSGQADLPTIIIARTVKGKGVSFLEGKHGWHGKALSKEELEVALKELGRIEKIGAEVGKPGAGPAASGAEVGVPLSRTAKVQTANFPSGPFRQGRDGASKQHASPRLTDLLLYDISKPVATRRAFGNALVRLGKVDPAMVVLDGDVQNSTYTEFFAKAYPDRFFQMFIAEQTMVGVALGLAKQGFNPYIATFACFLTRSFDQIRMAALSQANINICGSHAGVSIGQDGGSQMGLEDIAMFRAVHDSIVLYPSDPYQTERLVEEMAAQKGIVYLRTTRGETPVIYDAKETFSIGGSKVFEVRNLKLEIRNSATIVAAGITLHEALKAQKMLAEEGVGVRVIDCYSIKPIDVGTLQKAAKETKAMIVVEDHYPEGGLGEAVFSALSAYKVRPLKVMHLAVRKTPRSAKPAELLAYEEIDSTAIVKAVKSLIAHE